MDFEKTCATRLLHCADSAVAVACNDHITPAQRAFLDQHRCNDASAGIAVRFKHSADSGFVRHGLQLEQLGHVRQDVY